MPAAMFLDDRQGGVGSVVVPVLHGRRPMLVEIQSLIVKTDFPPRRITQGLDSGRLSVVLAVLSRHAGVTVGGDDAYASVVGGIRVDDPGADLGVALSVASSKKDVPIPTDTVAIGELGLGGEVRKVGNISKRLSEAARMGLRRAIVPPGTPAGPRGLTLIPAGTLREAIHAVGGPMKQKVIDIQTHAPLQNVDR